MFGGQIESERKMTTENKPKVLPVRGTNKYIPKGTRFTTVRDVIERCIRTGEPFPENYLERDPDEAMAEVAKE